MPELITLSELRTIAKLNSNVEERRVAAAIEDAHIEAEKILGREGYALVYANAPTFTVQAPNAAAYVTLLTGYLQPFMAWRAMQRAYPDLHAEADRAGVFTKSGEDFAAVDNRGLATLQAAARDRAEARLERLLTYLQDNAAVFTWVNRSEASEERITKGNGAGFIMRRSARQDHYRG